MKYTIIFCLIGCALLGLSGFCNDTPEAPASQPLNLLATQFTASAMPQDTIHFFISEAGDGPSIPDSVLKATLDSFQFKQLHYDTGTAQFRQLGKYPFGDDMEALLVGTEEFWFGKQTLILTDKKTGKVISLQEVSHFYGGDGGQTAAESWWFTRAKPPRIYTKFAQHGYRNTGADEPEEYHSEEGILLEWQNGGFRIISQPDSLNALKKFAMYQVW